MNSIVDEIKKISNEGLISIERSGYNRYIVFAQGSDRTKTAYCFGVPVWNAKTGNLIDMRFNHNKNGSSYTGSEARISVTDKVHFQNRHGACDLLNLGNVTKRTEDTIFFTNNGRMIKAVPTLNGFMLKMEYKSNHHPKLRLKLNRVFHSIRTNEKYFSVMLEQFVPFVTVSCIGALNIKGEVTDPCEIRYRKINDLEYDLEISCESQNVFWVAIEINLQEIKLFQDTTVESNHPKANNAFGGVAFLGNSKQCGEQWLYSRLELSNLPQLRNKRILKAVLHIPQLGKESSTLSVHRIAARFCSFGSNWQNKIAVTDPIAESTASHGYYHLDITKLLGKLKNKSENFVIRVKNKTDKPVMIPTGDNFYKPQILEVQYQ